MRFRTTAATAASLIFVTYSVEAGPLRWSPARLRRADPVSPARGLEGDSTTPLASGPRPILSTLTDTTLSIPKFALDAILTTRNPEVYTGPLTIIPVELSTASTEAPQSSANTEHVSSASSLAATSPTFPPGGLVSQASLTLSSESATNGPPSMRPQSTILSSVKSDLTPSQTTTFPRTDVPLASDTSQTKAVATVPNSTALFSSSQIRDSLTNILAPSAARSLESGAIGIVSSVIASSITPIGVQVTPKSTTPLASESDTTVAGSKKSTFATAQPDFKATSDSLSTPGLAPRLTSASDTIAAGLTRSTSATTLSDLKATSDSLLTPGLAPLTTSESDTAVAGLTRFTSATALPDSKATSVSFSTPRLAPDSTFPSTVPADPGTTPPRKSTFGGESSRRLNATSEPPSAILSTDATLSGPECTDSPTHRTAAIASLSTFPSVPTEFQTATARSSIQPVATTASGSQKAPDPDCTSATSLNNGNSIVLPPTVSSNRNASFTARVSTRPLGQTSTEPSAVLLTTSNLEPSPTLTVAPIGASRSVASSVIGDHTIKTATIPAEVYASNLVQAKGMNNEFSTLTLKSACPGTKKACVEGKMAKCSDGTFVLTECPAAQRCYALPKTNVHGVKITCSSPSQAAEILGIERSDGNGTIPGSSGDVSRSSQTSQIILSRTQPVAVTGASSTSVAEGSSTLVPAVPVVGTSTKLTTSINLPEVPASQQPARPTPPSSRIVTPFMPTLPATHPLPVPLGSSSTSRPTNIVIIQTINQPTLTDPPPHPTESPTSSELQSLLLIPVEFTNPPVAALTFPASTIRSAGGAAAGRVGSDDGARTTRTTVLNNGVPTVSVYLTITVTEKQMETVTVTTTLAPSA